MQIKAEQKLFHDFYFKIGIHFNLPITLGSILEEFEDIDVNAEVVAKIIQRNQYVENLMVRQINALGLKERVPSMQAAIALIGMQAVRDFICAMQIYRQFTRKHPPVDADGKFSIKPAEYLNYALRAEEFVHNRHLQYADTAYGAGLMFDLMRNVGREFFKTEKAFDEYSDEVFKHGLRTAYLGVELAKLLKGFSYSRLVFGACLVHDIGKLAMTLMYPQGADSYDAFRQVISEKPLTRSVIHYVETKRFGLTHEYYSSLLAYYFPMFREAERAILFHHDPFLLKKENKDLYQFACLIALASNMATNFRNTKDVKDPLIKSWLTPELADFKIEPSALIKVMHKTSQVSF